MSTEAMPEEIWDFSPPQIQGVSWRSSFVSLVARTPKEFRRLRREANEQGSRFTEGASYFSFDRPAPGTHNGTIHVTVYYPSPEVVDAIAYDDWQGEGYARPEG
jgi:hypothetical protein